MYNIIWALMVVTAVITITLSYMDPTRIFVG